MATASVLPPLTVPGLHHTPTIEQLRESTSQYNSLPDDSEQPHISELHLHSLAEVFERYNVQAKFGLHLIHRHLHLQDDTIMLGHSIEEPSGCWTKPTDLCHITPEDIHGHVFRISGDGHLVAYECRDGRPVDFESVNPAFFHEFIYYLRTKGLTNVLGLQVLDKEPWKEMVEIVLQDSGTVMLNAESVKIGSKYKVTGWVTRVGDGMVTFKGGESHATTTKGTHQVFVDGKPLPTIDALRELLREEGII